jgi:hypothetical protein
MEYVYARGGQWCIDRMICVYVLGGRFENLFDSINTLAAPESRQGTSASP